jgi:hypothetical protein
MGANSNWQSAIRLYISSLASGQHSAISSQPKIAHRKAAKNAKEQETNFGFLCDLGALCG